MTRITYSDGVAIYQLCFYVLALPMTILIVFRHGLMKSFGWTFLGIFCLMRIIGDAARLDLINHPDSSDAYTVYFICSVLGFSPLLLSSLGLIGRASHLALNSTQQKRSTIYVALIHLLMSVGVSIAIVGAAGNSNVADIPHQTKVRVGIVIFAIVLCLVILLQIWLWGAKAQSRGNDNRLGLVIAIATPFLIIRLIYTLLAVFSHWSAFSPFSNTTASVTVSLFMEVLMEMVVATLFIAIGLRILKTAEEDTHPFEKNYAASSYRAGDYQPRDYPPNYLPPRQSA